MYNRPAQITRDESDSRYVFLHGTCPIMKDHWTVRVRFDGLQAWWSGQLIQKALPELSDDERELIKTGITPAGWDKAFAE